MPNKTDWDLLLAALPDADQGRFERLLRRSLERRLKDAGRSSAIPEAVRSAAVGLWRQRYMEGRSKAARRRKSYAKLRHEATYLEIERELLERYRKAHGDGSPSSARDVAAMSFADACDAYRSTRPRPGGTALDGMTRDVLRRAYDATVDVDALCDELAKLVCDVARDEDVSRYARARQARSDARQREFSLAGVVDESGVAERVRDARLVAGVLSATYRESDLAVVVRQRIVDELGRHPDVAAVRGLMDALFGKTSVIEATLPRLARPDVRRVVAYLRGDELATRVARSLIENPRYGAQLRQTIELELRVRENVPETPLDAYPLARTMRRAFVLHVGPTNSGKTHDALRALAAADSGAYLGPLRLLAYEQFERLNRDGHPCSLLTGEELHEVAGARLVSSTVEMANYHVPIDVAVVDEAQMIADPDRGHHWTAAILGIPARRVHVCCAPHAERIVRELVGLCGDELEVERHERLVPLRADAGGFRMPDDVEAGDALVVFSKRAVHEVAAEVMERGLRPSMIYGALPHEVRHEEARRFDEGETDVVVATDAIGMGMNLPIRRVVFVGQEKFDGRSTRLLLPEEIQQIAGRAGRYGRYDVGLFQSARLRKEVRRRCGLAVPDIASIPVGIPDDIALVRDATLADSVRQWMAIEQPSPFHRIDVTRDLSLVDEVESHLDLDERRDADVKLTVLALATMAFDEHDARLHDAWRRMVVAELAGDVADLPLPDAPRADSPLADLEADYHYCDLLYGYARTFDHPEGLDLLARRRDEISRAIMGILAEASGG